MVRGRDCATRRVGGVLGVGLGLGLGLGITLTLTLIARGHLVADRRQDALVVVETCGSGRWWRWDSGGGGAVAVVAEVVVVAVVAVVAVAVGR